MPGLHHGNLCWGNRKSFYIYGEYPSEALASMDFRLHETTTQPSTMYVPSNGYYGYHKVTQQITDESMDTVEENLNVEHSVRVQAMSNSMVCRKRQSNEPNLDHVKRLRCQEASQSSETFHHRDGRTSHLSTYNLGFYML